MKIISILIWLSFWAAMLYSQEAPKTNEQFRIAYSASEQGNYKLAIRTYTEAITDNPAQSFLYYNRGMAYLAINSFGFALDDFKKANELKPTAEGYYQQGHIEYLDGKLADAKTDLQKARNLRKDIDDMDFLLGQLYYKDKEYAKAVDCLHDYTSRVQTNTDAYYYQGLAEAQQGNMDAANKSVKRAMFNEVKDPKYFYKMFELYSAIGENEKAITSLNKVIELDGHKPAYYKNRAALYLAMGQQKQSDEDLQTAKSLLQVANTDTE